MISSAYMQQYYEGWRILTLKVDSAQPYSDKLVRNVGTEKVISKGKIMKCVYAVATY